MNRIDLLTQLRQRWAGGLIAGVLIGAVLVRGVFQQPASAAPEGGARVWAFAWVGVVYGLADAVLLTVVPVLAVFASPVGG